MNLNKQYDVVIAGGGLAGLTLALQLRNARPGISILVLEKRKEPAPVATHKVGESLSELGSHYLREVVNLKDYLAEHQLRKLGFRFFFTPEHANDISRRVEVGSRIAAPFPTHQLDRGLLENELERRVINEGIDFIRGAIVASADLSKTGHTIYFKNGEKQTSVQAKWFIDSTGRSSFIKRKQGLEKEIGHDINSSWFRLDANIDIDYWSDNLEWRNHVEPGRRRLATNHLMGEGYWVWIIPLIDDKTSIGIVADSKIHPFPTINSFEKAMNWLEKFEPLAFAKLEAERDKLMDFKVMKQFAYDTKQFYSADRWALTGEAGAFMDPLYSPGSDFIGLGNSWITDLVTRDLNNEDIHLRSLIYEHAHKELLSGWIRLYRNLYPNFGKTQVMLMKIIWDWASYWAVPNVLFMNKGYTDLNVLKQYSSTDQSIGRRFAKLNENMQHLFRTWGPQDNHSYSDKQINVFDLNCLYKFQTELTRRYQPEELIPKIESNLIILEQIAAEIFRRASNQLHDTPPDMPVDPYDMLIDDRESLLLKKSGSQNALSPVEGIANDISKMWLKKNKVPQHELTR
jgi:flavin-dependent dehydrogenase